MASSHKFSMYLLDPLTGNSTTDDSFVSTKSTAYAVQHGGFRSKDPNGDEWTAVVLSRVRMRHTAAIPHSQKVGFRTSGIHLHHKSAPVVSHITVAPGTQLVFKEGASNEIHWVYDDFDGDEQTHWHVKIFDQYTYNSLAFSVNNSTPMFEQTGKDKSTSVSIDSALPVVTGTGTGNTGFVDGGVYYAAVRVAKDHNKDPFWSDWAAQQITVYVDQPKPPLLSVYTNTSNASNTLVIQSSDNLLGDNNGGMSKNQGDWQRTTIDASSGQSTVSFSHTAISNTLALTDGQVITSIPVGTTGYISTIGGIAASGVTTFKVSGKKNVNTSALGFPTTGTFWITIGSEKLLVRNHMDGTSKTPDTFDVVARGYLSTTATSHPQWAAVTYGLQQDIYTGSNGEIVHTFDVKKYGKPIVHHGITRWYSDATTSNNSPTVSTISKTIPIYQATDPNDKKSRNHFWVTDPGGTLQPGQKIQIVYNTWNKTVVSNGTYNPTNPKKNGLRTSTTTTENLHLAPLLTFGNAPAETVTIKSVETDKIVTTPAKVVGTVAGSVCGGPGHPITHIDIHMATDGTDAGPQNFNGVVPKNTPFIVSSGGKSTTVYVQKDTSWSGTRVGFWFWGWDKVTLPIQPVVKCPAFAVNGHTDGSYFAFPDGATVTSLSASNTNVKKITLEQNYGQGKFAGQVLTLNDVIYQTSARTANPSSSNSSGHYVTTPGSTQTPSWIEKQTAVFQFKVDTLASSPPVSFRNASYPATSASGFPQFNTTTITLPQFGCSFSSGVRSITANSNSDAASVYVGMPISGSGIQTGTTITSVSLAAGSNSIGISLPTTASSASLGTIVSVTASALSYNNYEVVMNGVPLGTTVTNTTASGNNVVLTFSASGTVPISFYTSSNVPSYFTTNQITLLAPSLNVIPAGSMSIPITPMKVNHNYPIHCPVRINYPALLGDNGIIVKPSPASGNATAEVSLVPSANATWTATNNIPVTAGQTYGLAGYTRRITGGGTPSFAPFIDWYNDLGDLISTSSGNHSVITPYFYGNVTSGSAVITSLTGTSTAVKVGNGIKGVGIPAGATIVSISGTSLTMSVTANATNTNVRISNYTAMVIGAPITFTGTIASGSPTTISGLSTTTGLAVGQVIYGYGLPFGTSISSITASASSLTISQSATAFSSGNSFRTCSTGVIIGEVGAPYYLSPMGQYGQNWTPNAIVGKAPDLHTLVSACYFTSNGDGTTGYYTVTAGSTTISLSAGATVTDGFGNTMTVIQAASAGSTTLAVGFNTIPSSSPTYLTVAATRAVPRFQWYNPTSGDVYALASVTFRSVTPNLPNSNYVPLATQLDTVQKPVSTTGYSPTSIILNKTTKTNGSETTYLLDPAMDYGTRETAQGASKQVLWTVTSNVVKKNDTSLSVTDVTGLAPGSTLTIGYGTANQEDLLIATGWGGYNPVTIDHSTPIKNNHPINDRVYAFVNSLQGNVFQPQLSGTPVAVFNWNSDGWINTPQATYTFTVQRSENNGATWTTLRNGGNLTVNSNGVATIQDYELTPGATQQYRAWATWVSPSGQMWQGETTYQLIAPVMSNNQWWISSTSNPALRYPLLVQNQSTETMKHPNGVLYPLGSRFPITIAGVVGGRDGSIDVMWTDIPNWQNFLNFLRLGEIYVLQNPVENTKSYIFINDDVTWENNASSQPYRKVTIPYIEAAPPNFGYTYGN